MNSSPDETDMTTSGSADTGGNPRSPDEAGSFFGAHTDVLEATPAIGSGSGGDHYDSADSVDDELDSEFAPQPKRRLGKLTVLLAALLVAGGGFLAGLQVQQHEGSTSATNPFAAAARRAGVGGTGTGTGGGFTGGGNGGFAGRGGAGGGTGTGTGTGTGAGTGTGTGTTAIPAVIGSIVSLSGETLVVENLGGKKVTVTLSATTTFTQTGTPAPLKAGENVTVSGTTGADGTVTATGVTVR